MFQEAATVVGGRAMKLQVGAVLVLPIHAVETNRLAPLGARLTPEQAEQVQSAARLAALETGAITEAELDQRTLPIAIFPQSLDPAAAAVSVRALRVLCEKSPDRRSHEMAYWRTWLGRRDKQAALRAAAPLPAPSGDPLKDAWVAQQQQQKDVPPAPVFEDAALHGGGMHGQTVKVQAGERFVVAALEKDAKANLPESWQTLASAARPDFDGMVKEAEATAGKIERLYLYERKADGSFDCVERWPAKTKSTTEGSESTKKGKKRR